MSSHKNIINQSMVGGALPGGITTLDTPNETVQRQVVLWGNSAGTKLGDSAPGHGVSIDEDGLIESAQGLNMTLEGVRPTASDVVWVNAGNGHLYHNDNDLEELSLPASSQDRELVIFTGTSGAVLDGAGVFVNPDGLIYDTIGVEIVAGPANPASASTLWIDSTDGHLHRGPVDLEEPEITLPGSSTNNAVVRWNGTSGEVLKDSTLILADTGRLSIGADTILHSQKASGNLVVGHNPIAAFSGNDNTLAGVGTGATLATTSNNNTMMGANVLAGLKTGTHNTAIGAYSGQSYTAGESHNILINASGVQGESDTTRIGTTQTRAFVRGIHNVTPTGGTEYVVVNALGQLGSVASIGQTYAEWSGTISPSAGGGSTTLSLARHGKMVIGVLEEIIVNVTPASPIISFIGVIPVGFRPAVKIRLPMVYASDGVYDTGLVGVLEILQSGAIVFTRDIDDEPSEFINDSGIDEATSFSYLTA